MHAVFYLQLGGNFSKEPEDMLKVEDSVDGPSTHVCTLTPSTQQILRKCFKDIVSCNGEILVQTYTHQKLAEIMHNFDLSLVHVCRTLIYCMSEYSRLIRFLCQVRVMT